MSDKLLEPSKWVQTHWSGDRATLTLTHLNKEDEGLYTLRVITKSGFETHSAYVFVRGEDYYSALFLTQPATLLQATLFMLVIQ